MNMVTLSVSTIEKVEKKLSSVLEEVRALKRSKAKKSTQKIRFWTEKQWEKAEKEAEEDIKAGRVFRLNSVEDLDKPLSEFTK